MTQTANSRTWHERALRVIPGGVSSPVRAFASVGGTPRYMVSGSGSRVTDVDGRSYVDFIGSWGPMIAGHAHPDVIEAVHAVMGKSFSFGAPGPHEVELAEEIARRVPACERVRFVSSGTEAVMTAVRLARAATGRSLIVKFSGCYHGHADSMLVSAGSGVATLGLRNSPGVTDGSVADTVVIPFNDFAAVTHVFHEFGPSIAAVITEPAPANMGVVPPDSGFVKHVYELTRQHHALLIFDEVMTGFRISAAGWYGKFAREEEIEPDLFTFGKVIGGGLPLAAVGGRADVMELLAPLGSVYQAGTLSGNPVATTAGLATLALCTDELYAHLDRRADEVGGLVTHALSTAGVPHRHQAAGNLFSFFFTDKPVRNFSDAQAQDTRAFAAFFHALLENGISIPPSAFEAWFVSAALTDDDMSKLERVLPLAARAAARVEA